MKQIEDIVLSYGEIHGIHDLVVHDYGLGRLLVSLHAEVPADENVLTLHDAIDRAELELADKLGCEAVIHMDPIDTNDDAVNEKRRQLEDLIREDRPRCDHSRFPHGARRHPHQSDLRCGGAAGV